MRTIALHAVGSPNRLVGVYPSLIEMPWPSRGAPGIRQLWPQCGPTTAPGLRAARPAPGKPQVDPHTPSLWRVRIPAPRETSEPSSAPQSCSRPPPILARTRHPRSVTSTIKAKIVSPAPKSRREKTGSPHSDYRAPVGARDGRCKASREVPEETPPQSPRARAKPWRRPNGRSAPSMRNVRSRSPRLSA